jgi:uncharacterized protein (TIGR03437 family)
MKPIIALLSLAFFSGISRCATVAGALYGNSGVVVAPGQIVRLEITGLKTVLAPDVRFQQATSVPLPGSLAGISASVSQTVPAGRVSYVAPLVAIEQINSCTDQLASSPECFITFVTVQVPYELSFLVSGPNPPTEIAISENGVQSSGFRIGVASDSIHVITSCDTRTSQTSCQSIVAHADGSLVSPQAPARPGETVVIYAWGLGKTLPPVKTGTLTPSPAPVTAIPGYDGVGVQLNFARNAAPSRPDRVDIVVAYLTPGEVGLYQVNVQLPGAFPDVEPCSTAVESNLTINLQGLASFDGARICAATP